MYNGLLVEVAEHPHGTFQLRSTSPVSRPYGQVLEVALSCGVYRGVIVVGMFFTKDPRLNDTSTDSR
jgi:hypothetical protein